MLSLNSAVLQPVICVFVMSVVENGDPELEYHQFVISFALTVLILFGLHFFVVLSETTARLSEEESGPLIRSKTVEPSEKCLIDMWNQTGAVFHFSNFTSMDWLSFNCMILHLC